MGHGLSSPGQECLFKGFQSYRWMCRNDFRSNKVDPANAMTNENPASVRATPIFM